VLIPREDHVVLGLKLDISVRTMVMTINNAWRIEAHVDKGDKKDHPIDHCLFL
jgi:hypothetical protein